MPDSGELAPSPRCVPVCQKNFAVRQRFCGTKAALQHDFPCPTDIESDSITRLPRPLRTYGTWDTAFISTQRPRPGPGYNAGSQSASPSMKPCEQAVFTGSHMPIDSQRATGALLPQFPDACFTAPPHLPLESIRVLGHIDEVPVELLDIPSVRSVIGW